MCKIFEEENHVYKIDFSKAVWATDQLNLLFHNANTELSDVDFVAETDTDIFFVEYKNSDIANAVNSKAFKPNADQTISKVVKKYYDSLTYINDIGKPTEKRKEYPHFPLQKINS